MSDQISENMAHKIFDANEQFNASGLCSRRERFISALKHFGLIKHSRLDEARAYVQKMRDFPRSYPPNAVEMGIKVADIFELAITEILEERE